MRPSPAIGRAIGMVLSCVLTSCLAQTSASEPFIFRDQDRIVLLGGTFIERMQYDGYFEAMLMLAHPEKNLTFRNLGWSGDTVWGESRGVFGTPADGFARLLKDVREAKPTVLMICYGANEAHAGDAGVPRFVEGLHQLLDALSSTQARVVLLSPPRRARPSLRLPDPHSFNETLSQYASAIDSVARQRNASFIDLTSQLDPASSGSETYAPDGVQFTPEGNRRCAVAICRALGIEPRWPADGAPDLREAIRLKNELCFHRYRPQNETYLFLFRKHEQGNNAVEIPQFDPLIAAKEREIAARAAGTAGAGR